MTFEIGAYLFYPSQGVGRVEGIQKREIAGQLLLFFLVRILDTESDILIPTASIERSGVRPLIDVITAEGVLRALSAPFPDYTGVPWIQRCRIYEEAISSGDPLRIADVYRDLQVMRARGPLSFEQLRTYEKSRRMLVFELALVLQIDPSGVELLMQERVLEKIPCEVGALSAVSRAT